MLPSHYLNQCWVILDIRNTFQLSFIQQLKFEENTFENVVCKMAAILFRPQCVNGCMYFQMPSWLNLFVVNLKLITSVDAWGPFSSHGFALIPTWISIYIHHRQNIVSAHWPQPTRSQEGKPEEYEFWPQPHWWAYRRNLCIVQARDTLSRGSYQPIVLASLWSSL